MAADTGEEQRRRGPGQPFRRGQSGNPNGRRAGARNRVTALALKLMDADAEAGDRRADKGRQGWRREPQSSWCWSGWRRCLATVRCSSTMPAIETSADLGEAMGAILQAAADGELTPDEAVSIASLIETRRRTIETLELEQRIAALEQSRETPG